MRGAVSSVLEVVGLCLLGAGAFMLAPWLGLVTAGAASVLVGLALDPPPRGDR